VIIIVEIDRIIRELFPEIKNKKLLDNGLIESDSGTFVPVYPANQLGFNFPGKYFLDHYLYPRLLQQHAFPLCPFKSADIYLNIPTDDSITVKEYKQILQENNRLIAKINYDALIPNTKFMVALFDGGHAVDDGVAEECGRYVESSRPMIGIRSDFRLAENLEAPINIAIHDCFDTDIYPHNIFYQGDDAYDNAVQSAGKLSDIIISDTNR